MESSWRTAFRRHPSCSCSTLPSDRTEGREHVADPKAYFDSLSPAEQDRVFTKSGAQAIRDGADIGRVVNARRKASGMSTATEGQRRRLKTVNVHGSDLFITSELSLTGPQGQKLVRLMPEQLYRQAKSPEDAIRLLKIHGYLY
jgi:hypothetical protein